MAWNNKTERMKKNIWIIAVMAVQFAALGYLFWNQGKGSSLPDLPNAPEASAFNDTAHVKSAIVAYINGDSINTHFQYIKDQEARLQNSLKGADAEFQREYAKREKEAQDLLQYANSKQLPEDEARVVEERLATLQGELQQIDAKMSEDIAAKKEAMTIELNNKVKKYLDKYAKMKNIDYVLNYQEGIPIVLYGNNAFNVTSEVLKGLNEEYQNEKKK
jgi:outer membrane protein